MSFLLPFWLQRARVLTLSDGTTPVPDLGRMIQVWTADSNSFRVVRWPMYNYYVNKGRLAELLRFGYIFYESDQTGLIREIQSNWLIYTHPEELATDGFFNRPPRFNPRPLSKNYSRVNPRYKAPPQRKRLHQLPFLTFLQSSLDQCDRINCRE